jgi:hypothetical protein
MKNASFLNGQHPHPRCPRLVNAVDLNNQQKGRHLAPESIDGGVNELAQLRVERDRLLAREKRMMELLGSASADHLVHDLRNRLNELMLYKALVERDGETPGEPG